MQSSMLNDNTRSTAFANINTPCITISTDISFQKAHFTDHT